MKCSIRLIMTRTDFYVFMFVQVLFLGQTSTHSQTRMILPHNRITVYFRLF